MLCNAVSSHIYHHILCKYQLQYQGEVPPRMDLQACHTTQEVHSDTTRGCEGEEILLSEATWHHIVQQCDKGDCSSAVGMLGQVRRVEPYCKYKGKKKHHNKQQVRQYSLTNKKRSKKRKPLTRSKIRGKYRSKRRRRRKGRRKEKRRRRKDRKLRV